MRWTDAKAKILQRGAARAPEMRFADLEADLPLLEAARQVADVMLREYPEAAQRHVLRWLGGRQEYFKA